MTEKDLSKLEGVGIEDLKYMDQRKKLVMINYLKDKIDQQKREKKEKKKAKKEEKRRKKEDKKRKKKRHDSRSRSRSSDRNDKDRD